MRYNLKTISALLILIFMISCAESNEVKFPEQILVVKTEKHIRIPGTKVFALMPAEFKSIKELVRYQKSDDLYVQIIESPGTSFTEAKPNFTKESIKAKGASIDILSNVKLNEYDAIYCEGPSKKPGETKLMLIFGDDSLLVMLVGVCKAADTEGKKGLQDIFKSVCYDKLTQIDPMELVNFDFDRSITNFKYAATTSNLFTFTESGIIDPENLNLNTIQIATMPRVTEEKAESFAKDLPWRFEQSGITLENKNFVKTTINNYYAYVLETKIKFNKKDGILYQAVLAGANSSVIFIGIAYTDIDSYLLKYKKTVESIRIQ